jgi:hypothetical protein
MVCYCNASTVRPQSEPNFFCAAKAMEPGQRQDLALQALAGVETIRGLAAQHAVSRKFIYQQVDTAKEALQEAFVPEQDDATKVLFYLPVTKQWLEQAFLGLALICHSSIRGIIEFCRDLLDYPVSVGKVHNVLQGAVEQARTYNRQQDLSGVRIGAHDEIFQSGWPVLVGADVRSSFCYLLSREEQRALQLVQPLVTFLENRAYEAIAQEATLAHKSQKADKARTGRRRPRQRPLPSKESFAEQLRHATQATAQAIALAEDVATLADWLRREILSLGGADYATRCTLFDFVVAELRARQPLCPHRIGPVVGALTNQRNELLAFAAQIDQGLTALASQFQLSPATVREVFNNEVLDVDHPLRWSRDAALRERLGNRFFAISVAVAELAENTVRASSVIENLNSRLRNYFFLRRHLGPDYLALLQFFLNHRRFQRSRRPERVGKSPAELLSGQPHPHWLEMLGYTRFSRN